MLKYSIKVNEKNIKREEMSWGEKFLSQDLSYISGVTSPSYHLEKYSIMPSTNSIVSSDSTLRINSTNVYRNGYCILRNKKYDINTLSVCMHKGNGMEYKDVKYIEYNGKYYYGVFDKKTGRYKFVIDSILKEENETVSEGSLTFETNPKIDNNKYVCFDTIFWIENGTITIDGTTYLYDANENCIHLSDGSIVTDYTDISNCDGIYLKHYDTPKEVTKFILTKAFDSLLCNYSKITYCSYLYFINVNGNFYYIVEEKNTEGKTEFVCYIDDERYNLLIEYKKKDDESSDDEMEKYYAELTEENLNEYGIYNSYNYNSLKSLSLYVRVKCDGEYKYAKVEHQIINANSGDRVLLQITDDYSNIGVGDIIKVTLDEDARLKVFSQVNDESKEKEEFVIYKGNRYNLIANLCDTVTIGDYEYDLSYINGNKKGDCIVSINGNDVTMSLVEGKKYVKPYNLIVSANTVNDTTCYKINEYDGVIINGEKYKRHKKYEEGVEIENCVVTDLNDSYYLEIDDILGKNNLSCKAFLPSFTLSQETETEINSYIISRIMSDDIRIDKCNKIFGVVEITPYIPFYNSNSMNENVFSSDYYFNLFSSLKLFCNVGYISIKLPIISKSGGDPIQSDIVNSKFFDKEREKAINPIIDMEKDIYYPKYIKSDDGVYNGSYTDFNPISEIRVNLHFRTRNLDTWKIDESRNWFITDYYPYKYIIESGLSQDKKELKALMEASDLVGLLGFTNNDVYYQKSKIGKSFLRFSYYDSIDPQNQTLLATSTVFMDEHSLFKKYIDNSRKNVNIYKTISETSGGTTCIDKITVESEFVDEKKKSSKATICDNKIITIDENKRLGSRLIISNKYNTDTSSEGFYIYMFKEYSKNLHPRQIFMKVDFNHAGVGLSLPFIKPMSWNKVGDNEELTPQEPLGLDSKELKEGILLEQKYAQDYIPLYAVYDFKNKEYAYVFDKRYVTVEDGIASLNLFELKIKDESGDTNDTDTKTYVIDSKFE